jgi:DNA-binding IclR family transcriptional regulator
VAHSEVATVARALRAIELLAARELSSTELARAFDVDRGTAARLLSTLEGTGYAERIDGNGRYRIAATKVIALYGQVEGRLEIVELATPILAELRDATNETANVSVLVEDQMMYVVLQRSRASVSAANAPGRRVAIHCSAIGKAYAAYLRPERVGEILARQGMEAYALRTIATPAAYLAHLERVRQLGYAVDDEETEFGMRCVAAPVRNYAGGVVAALGISGPSTRVTLERIHAYAEPVVVAARRLSLALGWEASAR